MEPSPKVRILALSVEKGVDVPVPSFAFSIETPKSVDDAVAAIQTALAQRGFRVLWTLDVNETLREKDLTLSGQVRILEVCSAPRAQEALETNPLVSLFLPCKVVAYERDGHTEIGLPRPSALMGMLDDPRLAKLALDVEEILVAAARQAAS